MLCPTCGKESANVRVCGFCHTPYPVDRDPRNSAARPVSAADARRTQMIRWGVLAVLVLALGGYAFATREKEIPTGVVLPDVIKSPMSADEAANLLKTTNASAELTERGDLLIVKFVAANFPLRRDGQLVIAQQYARADAIVLGRKRPIDFVDPAGASFATSDPAKGVMLTR